MACSWIERIIKIPGRSSIQDPKAILSRMMHDIENNTDKPIYIESNIPMQCYLVMNGSDTTHLTITYNKEFLSQESGICVLSIHNKSGYHIGSSTFDLNGKHELGQLFDLRKSTDRTLLSRTIKDFIENR
jgi:hypothetical protein